MLCNFLLKKLTFKENIRKFNWFFIQKISLDLTIQREIIRWVFYLDNIFLYYFRFHLVVRHHHRNFNEVYTKISIMKIL